MSPLIETILAVIIAAYVPRAGTHPDPVDDAWRLRAIAIDIVEESERAPLYDGPAGVMATALVLVTVANHESGFWSEVQDCSLCYSGSRWCDRGKSVTIYQLQGTTAWGEYSRDELCSSNRAATKRALAVLHRFRRNMPIRMFDGYARGGVLDHAPTRAARELSSMLTRNLAKQRIDLRWRNGTIFAVKR